MRRRYIRKIRRLLDILIVIRNLRWFHNGSGQVGRIKSARKISDESDWRPGPDGKCFKMFQPGLPLLPGDPGAFGKTRGISMPMFDETDRCARMGRKNRRHRPGPRNPTQFSSLTGHEIVKEIGAGVLTLA